MRPTWPSILGRFRAAARDHDRSLLVVVGLQDPPGPVASVFTIRRALLWSGEIEVPDTHLQRRPGPVAQLVGGRLGSWVRGLAVILGTMPP